MAAALTKIGDESCHRHPQPTAAPASYELKLVRHRLRPDDQLVGHLENVAAGRRRRNVPPRTLEDADAQFLFECGNASAEGRLTYLQSGGRAPEMAMTGQDDGELQEL